MPHFPPGQYHDEMSFSETIFLFVLALLVFGPKKLPEIARQAGRLLAELRRASNEFKSQIEQEISHLEVQEKQQILPPEKPVTSRSLSSAGEPVEAQLQPVAGAAPEGETVARSQGADAPESGAQAATPNADPLTPSTQEFHA